MVVFSLSVWLSRFRIKKPKKQASIMICGIFPSARAIKRLFGNRSRTIEYSIERYSFRDCMLDPKINLKNGIRPMVLMTVKVIEALTYLLTTYFLSFCDSSPLFWVMLRIRPKNIRGGVMTLRYFINKSVTGLRR